MFPLVPDPTPMTQIRFDYCTVTISDGVILAPSPTLTASLNTLAATLPGYGSLPFELDADYNIARGIIEKIGVGKIVRRDKRAYFRSNSGLRTADPRSPRGRNHDGISLNCKGWGLARM